MDNTWKQQCNFEHLGVLVLGNGNPICAYCGTPFKNEKESKPIQDKDFEIVTIKGNYNGAIYHNIGGMWLDERRNGFPHDCSKGMEGSGCEIQSVLRISDTKIFSVKDVTNKGVIKSFYLNDYGVIMVAFGKSIFDSTLNSIEHETKVPLFTTEDDVQLFERSDLVIAIDRKTGGIHEAVSGKSIGTWLNGWYTTNEIRNPTENDQNVLKIINDKWVFFANDDKAKEWQVINKPIQVVYKELSEYMSNGIRPLYYITVIDSVNNILKEFFKSKINNT